MIAISELSQDHEVNEECLLIFLSSVFIDTEIEYEKKPVMYQGSADSVIYIFKLRKSQCQPGLHLVLKILPEGKNASSFYRINHATDTLLRLGLKIPKIYAVGISQDVLGGSFILMEYLIGVSLLSYPLFLQTDILGRSHASMHNIDYQPLIEQFSSQNINEDQYLGSLIIPSRLAYVAQRIPDMLPVVEWCLRHSNLWEEDICICHGDYYPGNILMNKNKISGILDWGFSLSSALMDIAWTLTLLSPPSVTKSDQYPEFMNISSHAAAYLKAYQQQESLDLDINKIMQCRVVSSVFGLYFHRYKLNPFFAQKAVKIQFQDYIQCMTGIDIDH